LVNSLKTTRKRQAVVELNGTLDREGPSRTPPKALCKIVIVLKAPLLRDLRCDLLVLVDPPRSPKRKPTRLEPADFFRVNRFVVAVLDVVQQFYFLHDPSTFGCLFVKLPLYGPGESATISSKGTCYRLL